ncbi:MAG: membrane dipeptidase [Chitinophagales bacterium]|nr:membrane dipeptidase [Chitinophagales bacterium]
MNEEFIVDLHCHPNIKAFNSGHPHPEKDMWEPIYHKTNHNKFAERIERVSKQVLKESQCNLYKLAEGNVRLFNISLYPIEKGFLKLRNVPSLLLGKVNMDIMHEVILGFDAKRIAYLKKSHDYYKDLTDEYCYVRDSQGISPDGRYEFRLAGNYKELQALLKKKNTLVGIISIEGAHVFGTVDAAFEDLSLNAQKALMSERIREVKAWEYPPFTINLAHHFWNNLSGHATSFKMPSSALLNQNKGKDKGITQLGWHVIRELLSRENGKRILIDTKHMSAAARMEYYAFIDNYNALNPTDKIGIVFSHAGMNGFSTLENSVREKDTMRKARHHRLYKWSINVSNDEVNHILESGGLIGLMMDKGNLGGLKEVREVSGITDMDKMRKAFSKLFWDNAFQIVKAAGCKEGWDVVSLGTDYEGTITHMDPYESSAKLPLFGSDLQQYLENTDYRSELWYGYSPAKLVSKIMRENAMKFYERYFI